MIDSALALAYERERKLDSGLWAVVARISNEHPDGSVVEDAAHDAPVMWRTTESEYGLLRIELVDFATPEAPTVWFVHVDEPRSTPPACHLVAFADDSFPAGTVVSRHRFATLGIQNDSQAAAVRWYPATGLVHQVYVAADWRRRQLATHVLYAADAFHQANAWPGHLHGDGRRTRLGEQLVAGLRHPSRFEDLSETMPPMDA